MHLGLNLFTLSRTGSLSHTISPKPTSGMPCAPNRLDGVSPSAPTMQAQITFKGYFDTKSVQWLVMDAKKSRGTCHSDIAKTEKQKCNVRNILKEKLKLNLAGHRINSTDMGSSRNMATSGVSQTRNENCHSLRAQPDRCVRRTTRPFAHRTNSNERAGKELVVASSAGKLDGAGADVASGVLASSSTHDPLDLLRHEDGLSLLLAS